MLIITIVVAVISFALNIHKVYGDAVAAFYSPQARFWELLVGSILAYITLHRRSIFPKFKHKLDKWLGQIIYEQAPENNGKTLQDVQSVFGAFLILAGLIVITKERHFPGWWAVLPTIGTVLIISAGVHAWFNRVVLSNRVLVWFGLISFPLYLWHWPLLSFARIIESDTPSRTIRISAVMLSVAIAWLTYKFIEKPIRFGSNSQVKTISLFVFMGFVAFAGYQVYKHNGLPFRTGVQIQVKNIGDIGHDEFHKYQNQKFYLCTPVNIQRAALLWNESIRCLQSKNSDSKTIAIIGDSHAEHLFIGLAEGLTDANIVYYTKDSLPYINNKEFEDIFKSVINDPNITTIILSAYWSARLEKTLKNSSFRNELAKTVSALAAANKKVYIADAVPSFSFDPQKCKFYRRFRRSNTCTEDRSFFYDQYKNYFPTLASIAKDNSNVKILKMSDYFCDANVCNMARNGVLFYRDNNHLNVSGSKYVGKKLIEDTPSLFEEIQ